MEKTLANHIAVEDLLNSDFLPPTQAPRVEPLKGLILSAKSVQWSPGSGSPSKKIASASGGGFSGSFNSLGYGFSLSGGFSSISANRESMASYFSGHGDDRAHSHRKIAAPPLRYQELTPIAHGGVGVVMRGFDEILKREVAIKVVRPERKNSTQTLGRFHYEAEINARLQHPGIVPVYERGSSSDHGPYFAMKLVSGSTLTKLLYGRPYVLHDLHRFLGIFEQVAQTLAYAHDKGVIHRDLKPDNIMVGDFGEVQVMDWGFAKILDSVSHPRAQAASSQPETHDQTQNPENWLLSGTESVQEENRHSSIQRRSQNSTHFKSSQPPSLNSGTGSRTSSSSSSKSRSSSASGSLGGNGASVGGGMLSSWSLGAAPETFSVAGAVVGTPQYMAPEQAQGRNDLLDKRTDVFGLGAILCEILLGRPPYTGSAQFALLQAKSGKLDHVFQQLDKVEIDAELKTLVKRCLSRNPEHRLADASAVAKAISSYRNSHEERLREAELKKVVAQTKTAEEQKRRRLVLAIAFVVIVAILCAGGVWTFIQKEREVRNVAVLSAWREAKESYTKAVEDPSSDYDLWEKSLSSAKRAESLSSQAWKRADIQREITKLVNDATIFADKVRQLEEIRVPKNQRGDTMILTSKRMASEYEKLFKTWGMNLQEMDQTAAASWIRSQDIRRRLLIALDDWAFLTKEPKPRAQLMGIARQADTDEQLNLWREAVINQDANRLKTEARNFRVELANSNAAGNQEAQRVLFLGLALTAVKEIEEGRELLRVAQRKFPNRLWISFYLVESYRQAPANPNEATRYVGAARAIRPNFAQMHYYSGMVLSESSRWQEAADAFRDAVRLDPKFAYAHHELGRFHEQSNNYQKAGEEYALAVKYDPNLSVSYSGLGNVHLKQSQVEPAVLNFRKAVDLEPENLSFLVNLGVSLHHQGKNREALEPLLKTVKKNPRAPKAHSTLGVVWFSLGEMDLSKASLILAAEIQNNDPIVHQYLGMCYAFENHMEDAIRHYQRAIALNPNNPDVLCHLGIAYRGLGRYQDALKHLIAGHKQGKATSNWTRPSQEWVDSCERMLKFEPNLTDVASGKMAITNPKDFGVFGEIAYGKRMYEMSHRLYCKAFELDSKLQDDFGEGWRYNSTCSAILRANQLAHGDQPDPKAAEQMRRTGFQSLEQVFTVWKTAIQAKTIHPWRVKVVFHHWLTDPDLAEIRDPERLANLPKAEQEVYRKFWADVARISDDIRVN